jgi:hypothetical protein
MKIEPRTKIRVRTSLVAEWIEGIVGESDAYGPLLLFEDVDGAACRVWFCWVDEGVFWERLPAAE